MSAGSTESFYVPIEVSEILKRRHYVPDYSGRDIPVTVDDIVICQTSSQFKELEDILLPKVSWQDAFRFLRERYGIYAYIKRDTYWRKWRWVYEMDRPRGECISAVYDSIDEARIALFNRVDTEVLPRIFESPEWYEYPYEITEEEKEEGKNWRDKVNETHKKRREEFLKQQEESQKPQM